MILFKQAQRLSCYLNQLQQEGKSIGFVPTMGALHPGHISLLSKAKLETDITVCSIFVNPTQFNNKEDFQKYPTTIEQDIDLLIQNGCDVLFLPSTDEMYPDGFQSKLYNLGYLENILEGKYRPGHFQGVCQVVDKLLQIVDPQKLYVGQKDYQQCMIIQTLLQLTNKTGISLVIAPTLREEDGLAMSSRNLRLDKEQRIKASALYAALKQVKTQIITATLETIQRDASEKLEKAGFVVDYFEIADAHTLLPANPKTAANVVLVAAYLDDIRLIDNLPLN